MRRSSAVGGDDRLLGVDDEVEQHLLEIGEHAPESRASRRSSTHERDLLIVQTPLAELDHRRDQRRFAITAEGLRPCWRLKRDRLRMMPLARALSLWMSARSARMSSRTVGIALQNLRGSRNRLQRVVELVRDARQQHADRGETLLPDDLALQRLHLLAHAPLLFHLQRAMASRASRSFSIMSPNASRTCSSSRDGIGCGTSVPRSPVPTRSALRSRYFERRQPAAEEDDFHRQQHERRDAGDERRAPVDAARPRSCATDVGRPDRSTVHALVRRRRGREPELLDVRRRVLVLGHRLAARSRHDDLAAGRHLQRAEVAR